MIKGFSICCQGLVRSNNQDRADYFLKDDQALAFVADGMGGHYEGQRASETVAKACKQWWDTYTSIPQDSDFLQSMEQLRTMLQQCHEKIKKNTPIGEICGTTVVLLFITGGQYALFSTGDSRCYEIIRRFRFSYKVTQLTHDDISNDPRFRGKLTRALGVGTCELSLKTGWIHKGMTFALLSDGIYKFCPDMLKEMRSLPLARRLEDTAKRITMSVDDHGAPDNYSLVFLHV